MDGEKHGTEIETKTARKGKQTSSAHDQTSTTKKVNGAAARPTGVEKSVEVEPVTSSKVATSTCENDDYKALLDKQEARIRELEGQVLKQQRLPQRLKNCLLRLRRCVLLLPRSA